MTDAETSIALSRKDLESNLHLDHFFVPRYLDILESRCGHSLESGTFVKITLPFGRWHNNCSYWIPPAVHVDWPPQQQQ
jgi:hypothetical protein